MTRLDTDEALGYGYLERWRSSGRELLPSVRLWSEDAPDTPAATHPHVVVSVSNLTIDFSRVGTRHELRHRPGYLRVRGGYADYRPGALMVADPPALVAPESFPKDHLRDIFDALKTGTAPAPDETIDEPCLVLTREHYEYRNLFHAHTDWLSAFFAAKMLGLDTTSMRVLLLDPHPPAPLDEGLRALFSPDRPLLRRHEFGSRRVLLRHAVFVPPGYSSILWARLYDDQAGGPVQLLIDYGRAITRALTTDPVPTAASGDPVRVTLVVRRPARRWRRTMRQFQSEPAIEAALRSVRGVDVHVVDFARLTLEEQIAVAARTEVLVGAHGAGLAHTLAMAEHGAVVEIVGAPAAGTYRLYPNLAAWTGRAFRRVEAPEVRGWRGSWLAPDVEALARTVAELADGARARR